MWRTISFPGCPSFPKAFVVLAWSTSRYIFCPLHNPGSVHVAIHVGPYVEVQLQTNWTAHHWFEYVLHYCIDIDIELILSIFSNVANSFYNWSSRYGPSPFESFACFLKSHWGTSRNPDFWQYTYKLTHSFNAERNHSVIWFLPHGLYFSFPPNPHSMPWAWQNVSRAMQRSWQTSCTRPTSQEHRCTRISVAWSSCRLAQGRYSWAIDPGMPLWDPTTWRMWILML